MDREIKDRKSKIENRNLSVESQRSKVKGSKALSLRAVGEAISLVRSSSQGLFSETEFFSGFQKRDCRVASAPRNDNIKLTAFLVFLFSIFTFSFGQTTELERQVFDISRELRCPVCTSEAVADSNADVSIEMRNIIQEQLEEGKSREEILGYFQASYGDWILLSPPKSGLHLFVWLLPLIASAIGVVVLGYFFRRWTQRSVAPIDVSDDDLKRVREALER